MVGALETPQCSGGVPRHPAIDENERLESEDEAAQKISPIRCPPLAVLDSPSTPNRGRTKDVGRAPRTRRPVGEGMGVRGLRDGAVPIWV